MGSSGAYTVFGTLTVTFFVSSGRSTVKRMMVLRSRFSSEEALAEKKRSSYVPSS